LYSALFTYENHSCLSMSSAFIRVCWFRSIIFEIRSFASSDILSQYGLGNFSCSCFISSNVSSSVALKILKTKRKWINIIFKLIYCLKLMLPLKRRKTTK
jgi:hypothetical protein